MKHDSIAVVTTLMALSTKNKNYNMYYQNCRFSAATFTDYSDTNDNVAVIMKFNENDTLLSKKYVGFDARYFEAKVIATPDSECIVFANRIDFSLLPIQNDLYYIKFDKDGNQQYGYLTTPVSSYSIKQNIKPVLFPNPCKDEISIKYKVDKDLILKLYTCDGKLLKILYTKFNHLIDMSNLKDGYYTWQIEYESKLFNGILIKE